MAKKRHLKCSIKRKDIFSRLAQERMQKGKTHSMMIFSHAFHVTSKSLFALSLQVGARIGNGFKC